MHLILVASLDALCRDHACHALSRSGIGATTVLYDLLDGQRITRRLQHPGEDPQRASAELGHDCPTCAVRTTIAPDLLELQEQGVAEVILGLPATVSAAEAARLLVHRLDLPVSIRSLALACSPAALEDDLWDDRPLAAAACAAPDSDRRRPGEFLVDQLCAVDTVLAVDPQVVPQSLRERARGLRLLEQLAPQAVLSTDPVRPRLGAWSPVEAILRGSSVWAPGPAGADSCENPPFRTVLHRLPGPLDPVRLQQVLPELAAGVCWLRGHLRLAGPDGHRVRLEGIGPRVWLEPLPEEPPAAEMQDGSWAGAPATAGGGAGAAGDAVAATGDDIDPDRFRRLLDWCTAPVIA